MSRACPLARSFVRSSQSNQINKARLKVLQAQDEVLGEIAEQTKHHLIDITKDGAVYSNLMSRLLLQVHLSIGTLLCH